MKFSSMLIFSLLFSGHISWAACKEHTEANFSAEFEIVKIETPQIECIFDEQGNILKDQPAKMDKDGCVLSLSLIKVKKGKPPASDPAGKIYSIYDNGPLCKKKVGNRLVKEVEFSGGECCAEREVSRQDIRWASCRMTPKPVPIVEATEKYVRCSQKGVVWKFVGK